MFKPNLVLGALVASAFLCTACVAPSHTLPTLAVQREAIERAHAAYVQDLDLLTHQVTTALDARETLLRGSAHRELIARGYITPALEADPAAFDTDLSDPDTRTALLTEVRLGRLSRENAHEFLRDYALALRMKHEGTAVRDAMLARLQPLEEATHTRAIITESLAARRESVLRLLDDAAASNTTLNDFAQRSSIDNDPRFAQPVSAWRELLERLTTPPAVTSTESH